MDLPAMGGVTGENWGEDGHGKVRVCHKGIASLGAWLGFGKVEGVDLSGTTMTTSSSSSI